MEPATQVSVSETDFVGFVEESGEKYMSWVDRDELMKKPRHHDAVGESLTFSEQV